jgi:hypothetical protein
LSNGNIQISDQSAPKPTQKPLKLTIKQRKFIKNYIELGNATEAAKLAGYKSNCEENFRTIASHEIAKLNLPISELMSAAGIDDLALTKVISEGLRLNPALSNTPKYLETSLKLRGYLKNDIGNGSQGSVSVNVISFSPVQVNVDNSPSDDKAKST